MPVKKTGLEDGIIPGICYNWMTFYLLCQHHHSHLFRMLLKGVWSNHYHSYYGHEKTMCRQSVHRVNHTLLGLSYSVLSCAFHHLYQYWIKRRI